MSVSQSLQKTILSRKGGDVFCANDFLSFGSKGNIDIILHRLAKQGTIRRLEYGLYDIPRKSSLLGDLSPDIKDIMDAYSRKMGQIFVLAPLNAANALSLTTQVPSKIAFLTDGKTHTLNVCGLSIHLIHASPKKLAGAMTSVGVIIQALCYFLPKGPLDEALRIIANKISPQDLRSLIDIKSRTMRKLVPYIDRIAQLATIH